MEQERSTRQKQGIFLKGKMDLGFLALVMILLVFGLIMLFSASYPYAYAYMNNSYHFIIRQASIAIVGVVLMLLVSKINAHVYKKFAWIVYFISTALLVLLLILPIQIKGMDVKRWLVLGPISFQPSEIAKFSIILLFATYISKNYSKMKNFKEGIVIPGLLLAVVCALVLVEPHLSATALIFIIGAALMIFGGIKWKYVIGAAGIGVIGIIGAIVTGVISYGSSRITYWLNPWADATGKGYQTIQSLLAIGSGGIMGRGFGQSHQKYLWLPEPHNDFIFAVVCEELGLIGALALVILFCLLLWRGFVIAMRAPDKYSALLAAGLTFQVGLQAALNILVVTNTLPNTGISLPFFSYGGTALLLLLVQMGIVLAISRTSNLEKS